MKQVILKEAKKVFLLLANLQQDKRIETGRLYAKIITETFSLLFPNADPEFRVFLDRRQLKSVTQMSKNKNHLEEMM